jgi:site-specific DNA-adenine methylase
MNAPIRYFGGKGMMRNKLYEYFPNSDIYNIFVDGFGGSGTMLLGQERAGKIEIYNDLEENVYSLYKVLSDESLYFRLKKWLICLIIQNKYAKNVKKSLKRSLPC